MATPGNGGPPQNPNAQEGQAQQSQAQLSVLGQYVKDLSFENPNAPRSLAPTQTQPAINIQINVIIARRKSICSGMYFRRERNGANGI